MRYGLYLPNYGRAITPRNLVDLAHEAELAGWDGFFLWDHILASRTQALPMLDPWVALAGMAVNTSRLRLGTTVTPLARRRPWKVARETTTLDHLSNGRVILGIGLGFPGDVEFGMFGEDEDPHQRAVMLDEGLEILEGFWRGLSFSYQGEHYKLEKMRFLPKPVQQPRIPVWVGGFWPNPAPFRRAARWDGVIPLKAQGWLKPDEIRTILDTVQASRQSQAPFDLALINSQFTRGSKGTTGADKARLYAEAGATWWLESLYLGRNDVERLRATIQAGPPR